MIFTDLSYFQIGHIIVAPLLVFFSIVVLCRFILAFRNFIYTGEFGDYTKSFLAQLVECNKFAPRYAFTGYHPGFVLADGFFFFVISFSMTGLWGVYLVVGLFVFLATTMRKRIAHKQEFVNRLDGTHEGQ